MFPTGASGGSEEDPDSTRSGHCENFWGKKTQLLKRGAGKMGERPDKLKCSDAEEKGKVLSSQGKGNANRGGSKR